LTFVNARQVEMPVAAHGQRVWHASAAWVGSGWRAGRFFAYFRAYGYQRGMRTVAVAVFSMTIKSPDVIRLGVRSSARLRRGLIVWTMCPGVSFGRAVVMADRDPVGR
jgi:hypothetical protein